MVRYTPHAATCRSILTSIATPSPPRTDLDLVDDPHLQSSKAADLVVQFCKDMESKSQTQLEGTHMAVGGDDDDGRCRRLQKKRKMPTRYLLIQDIVLDILTRLPVKSLVRFKVMCKSWYTLISDPHFINSHMNQLRKERGFSFLIGQRIYVAGPPAPEISKVDEHYRELITNRVCCYVIRQHCNPDQMDKWSMELLYAKDLPFFNDPYEFPPIQHCNGLLLIRSPDELYVCNPATREFLHLPSSRNVMYFYGPEEKMPQFGFGFDSSTNKYKVVRYFHHQTESYSLGFEVLTLGSSAAPLSRSSWKLIAEEPPYPLLETCVACVGGALYWNIDNSLHNSEPVAGILCFDLSDEKFSIIPPPPPFLLKLPDVDLKDTLLTQLDGHLCCVDFPLFEAHVWVMRGGTWSLMYTIDFPKHEEPLIFPIAINQGMLLCRFERGLYSYNPQTTSFTNLMKCNRSKKKKSNHALDFMWYETTPYTASMVPIGSR